MRKLHSTLTIIALICSFWATLATPAHCDQTALKTGATKVFDAAKNSIFTIKTNKASGTGFLCLDNQTVVTCFHVIEGASSITVTGTNDANWSVIGVRYDKDTDLALLTLDRPSTRKVLKISGLAPITGQNVFVIGTALGVLEHSLSEGLISGQRNTGTTSYVQISAAISPGISGAPVLTSTGEVIGVVSSTLSRGQNLNLGSSAYQIYALESQTPTSVGSLASSLPVPSSSNTNAGPELTQLEAKLMARLFNQIGQAYMDVNTRLSLPKSKVSSSEAFSRYWLSNANQFIEFPPYPGIVRDVDVFESQLRSCADAYLNKEELYRQARAERIINNSFSLQSKIITAQDTLTEKFKALRDIWIVLLNRLSIQFSESDQLVEALSGAAKIHLFRDIRTSDEIFGSIVPDYASQGCVIALPILLPDDAGRIKAKSGQTFEEAVEELAIVKTGAKIFAIMLDSDQWISVKDWDEFYLLTKDRNSGTIMIGISRSSAVKLNIKILRSEQVPFCNTSTIKQ